MTTERKKGRDSGASKRESPLPADDSQPPATGTEGTSETEDRDEPPLTVRLTLCVDLHSFNFIYTLTVPGIYTVPVVRNKIICESNGVILEQV